MVGAVLVAYGPDKILWGGLLYVVASLVISPLLGLIFGMVFLKMTLRIFRNATPKVNYFFNRMQIPSSIALALSHGSNDVQKSIGLIVDVFCHPWIFPQLPCSLLGYCKLRCGDSLGNSDWRMENHQDRRIKNLSPEVCACFLCSNFLGDSHFRSCVGRRSSIDNTCRVLQYHGCWGWSEDLSSPVGSSEEYHPGLVDYYSSLSSDGRIKFFYYSVVALHMPKPYFH